MYDKVYRKAKGIVTAQLTTVEPADRKIKDELLPVVAQITGGTVDFQTKTNPGIIGGFILEIEDKRLDASVKNQLDNRVLAGLTRQDTMAVKSN